MMPRIGFWGWILFILILAAIVKPALADESWHRSNIEEIMNQPAESQQRALTQPRYVDDGADRRSTYNAYRDDARANGDVAGAKTWDDRARSEGGY